MHLWSNYLKKKKGRELPGSPAVKTFNAGARGRSPVRKLKFYMLCGTAKKLKNKREKKNYKNQVGGYL